ncbi:MAG: AbrB/MazE/SpoVT family DNA-binding domain-containing protein [Acidimicrobiia bacterium]|nr:AbrB/MazE/SpoVT family DNA-binding domain-containing protein [Acidimicrobiia bacterium]MYB45135.1 AbrB/MazE/SpoVT family DNA-binding domain-containing protein [Acidimicrobiia bacterium]MYC84589.1 AbrB/MazE/SpoVT family DNA-binding domain-containing protein [Acidimicrobiia bacterium]
MDGTHAVTMGDRGRLVVPAEVRARHGFDRGTVLVFTESPWGLVLTKREALLAQIQSELKGSNLVDELLTDRRRQAAIEDDG